MSDTLLRHWTLLRAIPRAPRGITVLDLHRRMEQEGYRVTRRTVERDLELLSGLFPLRCDDSQRPYLWSWPQDRILDVPGMDPTTALTFALASRFLEQVLPRTSLSLLTLLRARPRRAGRHRAWWPRGLARQGPHSAPRP